MEKLELEIAQFTAAGVKPINEDFVGYLQPTELYTLENKGITLAVADGVSTAEAGREASETAIERFLEEYYQTPDTWSVARSGEKILSTINLRLYRKSHEFTADTKGYLCTFSAFVIKSRTAHFFHVGDSRIYLLRGDHFKQLTTDHVATIADNRTCLSRAMGMDSRLHIDHGQTEIMEGDRLLFTSDGIHDFIEYARLQELLSMDVSVEELVQSIQLEAVKNNTDDNISVIVAEVKNLPEENLQDYSAQLTRLPFPPVLEVGMKLDGFRVKKEVFASNRSQLYLVCDEETGEHYAMKTPSRNFEDDISYIDRFIQEEWIGKRIHCPNVVKVIKQSRTRTALYYLMEYVEGEGLDQWIEKNQPPSPKKSIAIVKEIANGLRAFHDNEAIHQDLKPGNIMLANDGRVLILDFGSVYVAGLAELQRPIVHDGALGTASYSDPLYLTGHNPGIQGDVYALATIVYEMFTGHLPYGKTIEECNTAMDYDRLRYRSASGFNPILPVWFDRALEKGVNFDLENRYLSIDEFMKDITQPNPEFLKTDPVIEKNASTMVFWKLMSGFWFLSFILVIYLFTKF